jgi:hypothetical protein
LAQADVVIWPLVSWSSGRCIRGQLDAVPGGEQDEGMSYQVSDVDVDVEARPTAVVAATTTWQQFATLWGSLLGEVWDCLRAAGITRGCRNVMLYRDDVPNVEVGVVLDQPCPLTGTRWEVYGPHHDDPAQQWTEVYWQLHPGSGGLG